MTEPEQFDDDPSTAVAAAFIHDGKEVTYSFFHSWEHLRDFDASNLGRIPRAGVFSIRAGTDDLGDARNMAVRNFLAESKEIGRASWRERV